MSHCGDELQVEVNGQPCHESTQVKVNGQPCHWCCWRLLPSGDEYNIHEQHGHRDVGLAVFERQSPCCASFTFHNNFEATAGMNATQTTTTATGAEKKADNVKCAVQDPSQNSTFNIEIFQFKDSGKKRFGRGKE